MPKAVLPTTAKGWAIAIIASFVGFISGFATIRVLGEKWR